MLGMTGVAAPASVAATPKPTATDRAATHAYLLATEAWDEAELANLPQSNAAVAAAAAQISSECPGVLTGAPPHEHELRIVLGSPPPNARAEGERHRESRQRDDLKAELSAALDDASKQSNRTAEQVLVGAIASLKWSNPAITEFLHITAEYIQEDLNASAPSVCADMRSWVASGYRTLAPASKEFKKRSEALIKRIFAAITSHILAHIKPFPQILAPYESVTDRALFQRTRSLTAQLRKDHKARDEADTRLEAAVGLPPPEIPQFERTAKKPTEVAHGRTAAGGHFVVLAERATQVPRFPHESGCNTNVTIEESARTHAEGFVGVSTGSSERCLSRSHVTPEQKVECDSGQLTIEANLLPAARSVRLLLSNNRTITSPAIRVPARLGGPAGLYYQAVRGPSPIPVSLTELDAHGNQLTVLKLPAVVECAAKVRKYVHDGIVRLAHASLPQGPTFTIRAERYRELGRAHFELRLSESGGDEELFGGENSGSFFSVSGGRFGPPGRKRVFSSQVSNGCKPQPYEIVYGVLKAPRDTVLARVSGKLVPLHVVGIPARLHAGGVLAYGAFSPIPTELVVRDARGKTVSRENLGSEAKSETERCEGEAEG